MVHFRLIFRVMTQRIPARFLSIPGQGWSARRDFAAFHRSCAGPWYSTPVLAHSYGALWLSGWGKSRTSCGQTRMDGNPSNPSKIPSTSWILNGFWVEFDRFSQIRYPPSAVLSSMAYFCCVACDAKTILMLLIPGGCGIVWRSSPAFFPTKTTCS